jgi:hypothetical protein
MTLGKIFIWILLSFLIISALVVVLNFVSNTEDPLKEGFNLLTGYTCIVCFGFGFGSVMLYDKRKQTKNRSSFFYFFIGTLNIVIGLAGLYALFAGILTILGLLFCFIPCVIGVNMLNLLFAKRVRPSSGSHNIGLPE